MGTQDFLGVSSVFSRLMAKPKHGQCQNTCTLDIFKQSSPTNHRCYNYPYLRRSRQQRRRPSGSSSSSIHCPSPAVLSALAVIAATPAVAGTPLPIQTAPPSFLCPFIERDNIDPSSETPVTIPPPPPPPPPPATPAPTPVQHSKRLLVADKYVQGPDNQWRKTDVWTLYGSTCCSSTNVPSVDDVQAQPSPSSQITMTSVTPTPIELDASMLPAGWKSPSSTSSNTESTIILSLAIVIAGSICIFMVGCIIWRRRKKSTKDIEHKVGKKLRPDDASELGDMEKDARGKMRIWAKATARWKANIRHSARRRRKRHIISSKLSRSPSPALSDSQEVSADVPFAASPRRWFTGEEADSARFETMLPNDDNTPTIAEQSPVEPIPITFPRTSSPPAYRSPVMQRPPHCQAASDLNATRSRHSSLLFEQVNYPVTMEDEPIPYMPPSSGHVATDDKAHLARIQQLASAPPEMVGKACANTMRAVSAPEWHEALDELDDLVVESGVISAPAFPFHDFALPPSFPPLPTKGDVPSGYFDANLFCYGEDDGIPVLGLDAGPSASLFDAHPSAPPIGDLDLDPSAPSLEDEDEPFHDWDRSTSYVSNAPGSESSDAPAAAATTSMCVSSTSGSVSLASRRGSVTRDGMLPLYHP
ncbi:hypothetical protein BS17DRAFT_778777 [Gyrodon lividus]|nr:hypothetical protein BS17DRAFT_778777 [Gyrodon lividus]